MVQQRHEMYRPIHKALRHMLYTTSRSLGIADFRDDGVTREAVGGLERTIMLLETHAMYEQVHQNDGTVYAELRRLI